MRQLNAAYEAGKAAAFAKFAINVRPGGLLERASLLLDQFAAGGGGQLGRGALLGMLPGAIGGAIQGGEGHRLEGAGRGAVGGAAIGAVGGALGHYVGGARGESRGRQMNDPSRPYRYDHENYNDGRNNGLFMGAQAAGQDVGSAAGALLGGTLGGQLTGATAQDDPRRAVTE